MHTTGRRTRQGSALATGVLIVLTVLGVLSMHSVTSAPSSAVSAGHESVSTGHESTGHEQKAAEAADPADPVMVGEHGCPTGHQMMHPCMGTTTTWAASTTPTWTLDVDHRSASTDRASTRAESVSVRAPPWTVRELDRSVTLRV